MAKMTLLEMVQDILNDMDSDEVNSITDTTESSQVAQIIKTTYFDWMSTRDDWPFLRTLTSLTGLGDTTNPTKMQLADSINSVEWIKYNKKDVTYKTPKEFKDILDGRTEEADVFDSNGIGLAADPQYWTSYDDTYVVFDSYDATVELTLQTSKAVAYGSVEPSWTASDSFTPTLPAKMFPTLLASAKGTAFLTLKQQANAKEEAKAQRGRIRAASDARKIKETEIPVNSKTNYGRK